MNTVPFRPFGAKYLVLPDPIEGESEVIGEITLSTPKDPHKQSVEGTVVARGKSCVELDIKDKAVYGQYSGYDHKIDGVDYKVLSENELLGQKLVTPFEASTNRKCPVCKSVEGHLGRCMYLSGQQEQPVAIVEAPPPGVPYLCDQCFRSDGKPHYGWCPTLVPVEAAPEPDRTPLGEAALIPEDDIPW